MGLSSDQRWANFRRQMPVTAKWAYFDHAAVSPLPAPARDAIAKWLAEAAEDGGPAWGRWDRRLQDVRARAAGVVGATSEEIALVRSTSEGVSLVAEGYPWREGDNVVIPADEFPTNQYPWLNLASRKVETRRVPTENGRLDLNKLEAVCDKRTRIVALSWVGFLSGWRTDLRAAAEMAHRRGALLFVDAIQGLGAFPLDVRETQIDFFSADGHKWMLGPEGAGFFYIRREHLAKLRPIGIGWNSVVQQSNYTHIELQLKDTATRYEGGSPNCVGFIGLGASLDLLADTGIAAIGNRLLEITNLCCQRLESIGAKIVNPRENADHCSGIVTFELPGCDSLALRKHCYSRHVALAQRAGRLRISPHAYINDEDIERLVAVLEEGQKICPKPADKR
jgi:cysteine desulfurase / selenocysteine lyase